MTSAARQVEGISILSWDPAQPQVVLAGLRQLLDAGNTKHVLLDLSGSDWVRADGIESLSEATTVCSDRDCPIGMFGVSDDFYQLIKVMSLAAYLPPMLGADEGQALGALQRQDTLPEAPKLDINIDLATAPTARFDPQQLEAPAPAPSLPTQEAPPAEGLLAVNWADLTQMGYSLGGPDAGAVMAACAGGVVTPPSQEDGVIDLGEDGAVAAAATAPAPSGGETAAGVLETEDEGDFSPLDDTQHDDAPPAFVRQAGAAAMAPTQRQAPLPAQPATPAAQTTPPPARTQQPAARAPAANMFVGEDDDAAVMMQLTPEALAAAVQSYDAAAASQEPPAGAAAPTSDPSFYSEGSDDDQAVMFQPGAFDAALLAEVAAAAGPESSVPVPEVEAPAPAPGLNGEEGELRTFLRDYAIRSALHVQVLERFLLAGDETLGPNDLQAAGQLGAMRQVLDELVQCRVVRRTRCSRVRGGTGFLFSASPAVRNQVVRLVKLWQGPQTRAQVAGWLNG